MNDYKITVDNFKYPELYDEMIARGLSDFGIWYLMDSYQASRRYECLLTRYPNRVLIPFARRDDCDDIACFELGKGHRVQVIHDFASQGWEQRNEYASLHAWLLEVRSELEEEHIGLKILTEDYESAINN